MESLDWIAAARQGDLSAYNRLVESHQDAAYNLAYRILCDPVAAEEAVQAAFLQAYRELGRYRRGVFQEWLFAILVRVCRNRFSRASHRPGLPNRTLSTVQKSLPLQAETCLQALPLDLRLVITLIDLVGLDMDQASAVLGLPAQTIRTRLAQARQQMALISA